VWGKISLNTLRIGIREPSTSDIDGTRKQRLPLLRG